MKGIRFYMSDNGLILESPLYLTERQEYAVREYAIEQYKHRHRTEKNKEKQKQLEHVIMLIVSKNYIQRPIPKYDCEQEIEIYG